MSTSQKQSSQPPSTSTSSSSQPSLPAHFATLAPAPLTAHMTDSTAHTILTTAETPRQAHSLQSLSHAYLSAHDTATRMNLGLPLRVTVATGNGTVVIQTGTKVDGGVGGGEMVVGTVVAPEDKMAEARVASWGVEEVAGRVGRVIGEGRVGRQ